MIMKNRDKNIIDFYPGPSPLPNAHGLIEKKRDSSLEEHQGV